MCTEEQTMHKYLLYRLKILAAGCVTSDVYPSSCPLSDINTKQCWARLLQSIRQTLKKNLICRNKTLYYHTPCLNHRSYH